MDGGHPLIAERCPTPYVSMVPFYGGARTAFAALPPLLEEMDGYIVFFGLSLIWTGAPSSAVHARCDHICTSARALLGTCLGVMLIGAPTAVPWPRFAFKAAFNSERADDSGGGGSIVIGPCTGRTLDILRFGETSSSGLHNNY